MDKVKLKTLLITPDTTIKQAMQKLNETSERVLFVVDDQKRVLGTLNDGDIRRGLLSGRGFNDSVEKIMQEKFISIDNSMTDLENKAKQLMFKTKIERIPVLDDGGRILDVILWSDILGEKKRQTPRQPQPNQVVIMAGGKGTRLNPFTMILPKPLIPIGNKTVIDLIMEKFHESGFDKFIYTLNYKKEYLKLYLKESRFSYCIDWIEEEDYLGTAGGLSMLKDKITGPFFITNCDSLLDINYLELLKWHKDHKVALTIVGCHNEVHIPFGVLQLSNGSLEKISEKPVHDVIINTGVYVMEPHVLNLISDKKAMDMDELIDLALKEEKVSVYPIYKGWLDIGQWEEYKKSIKQFKHLAEDEG